MLRYIVVGMILGTSLVSANDAALPQMPAQGEIVAVSPEPPRQFDFWLGEWNVQNKHLGDAGWADSGEARALIQSVANGGAVLEQWNGMLRGNPLIGFSLRAFDPQLGKWVIWLNWHGGRPGGFSPMHGVYKPDGGDRIELFPPKDDTAMRYTFSQPREGSCQWDQATSKDGAVWATDWVMQFTRRGEASAVDASDAPIETPPNSALRFHQLRNLDYLIGSWKGRAVGVNVDAKMDEPRALRGRPRRDGNGELSPAA